MAKVLVTDDEESDWLLLKLAFKRAGIPVELTWARDGMEAVDHLTGELAGSAVGAKTKLVLLDLKMPRMNGFEVLEWWREQPQLAQVVVVVFSSSTNPDDMKKAVALGAREHVVKPTGFENIIQCVKNLYERYVLAQG